MFNYNLYYTYLLFKQSMRLKKFKLKTFISVFIFTKTVKIDYIGRFVINVCTYTYSYLRSMHFYTVKYFTLYNY